MIPKSEVKLFKSSSQHNWGEVGIGGDEAQATSTVE
jgi:hypothetical protein